MNRTAGNEGILKERRRISQLGNELSVNVNMCDEMENMLEMEKNRSHSTQINEDSFLIRRKSFNPDLVNRLNSFDPNITLTSKLTRQKTSQVSNYANFSKTSYQNSHPHKAANSPYPHKNSKPIKIHFSKAATNLHKAKQTLPSHDQSHLAQPHEARRHTDQKFTVQVGSKEWRKKVQKNRKQIMQMKKKWEEQKKQVDKEVGIGCEQDLSSREGLRSCSVDSNGLNSLSIPPGDIPSFPNPLALVPYKLNQIESSQEEDQDCPKPNAPNRVLLTQNIVTGGAYDAEDIQTADQNQDTRRNRAEKGMNQEINDIKMLETELTSEANGKKQFYQVAKNVLHSGMLDKFLGAKYSKTEKKNKYTKDNVKNKLAQMKFIQKCKEENVLAVPVINKLKEKRLILENYRMNEGLSKALEAAIEELAEYIEVIALKSNDMNDASLSKIINGVSNNPYVKTLKIEKNKLDEECAKSLKTLLCEFDEELGQKKKSHIESISVHD